MSFLKGLLNLRDQDGSERFNWTVEAVFADPDDPKNGMYATLGVYKSKKEAEARQEFLANYCIHDYLVFRYRKMYNFKDFIDLNDETILLGNDTKFNEQLIKHSKKKEENIEKQKKIMEIKKEYSKNDSVPGTIENFSRLLYLAQKSESESKILETEYNSFKTQIQEELKNFPDLKNTWEEKSKKTLDLIGEIGTFDKCKNWFDLNIEKNNEIDEFIEQNNQKIINMSNKKINQNKVIIEEPNTQRIIEEPNNQQIIKEPNTPEIIKEPNTPEIIEEPNTQEIVEELNTQAIVEEPNTQAIVEELNTQAIVEELNTQAIVEELNIQEIIEETLIIEELNTQEIIEEPEELNIQEIIEETLIIEEPEEPNIQEIIEEPNTQAIVEEPEEPNIQEIIEEPNTQAIVEEPNTQEIIEELNTQAIVEEPNTQAIVEKPEEPNTQEIIEEPNTQAIVEEPEEPNTQTIIEETLIIEEIEESNI